MIKERYISLLTGSVKSPAISAWRAKGPREKDVVAREYLEKYISEIGIKGEDVMKKMWSRNPYFEKGGW